MKTVVVRQLGSADHLLWFRVELGPFIGAQTLYALSPDDQFEDRLLSYLEEWISVPYLDSYHQARTREYIAERGVNLGRAAFLGLGEKTKYLQDPDLSFEVVGDETIFKQAWETARLGTSTDPLVLTYPFIRVVQGTSGYAKLRRGPFRRVLVLSARLQLGEIVPPRLVTKPLVETLQGTGIRYAVISPAYPRDVELALAPSSRGREPDILHIDSHGVLLTYDELVSRFKVEREEFENNSWGQSVVPYQGPRGFILLNLDQRALPVSGAELANLASKSGVRAVVLNACRAGALAAAGSFALDLIQGGVPEVVAVRHVLTSEGASLFTPAFYSAIAQGGSIGEATRTARHALYANRSRRLGEDLVELDDWLSVVHYAAEHGRPRPGNTRVTAPPRLPKPQILPDYLEWKIAELQAHLRASEPETPRVPVLVAGAIGLGQASVVRETARWMAVTGMWTTGAAILDASSGFSEAFLAQLRQKRFAQIAAEITETSGARPVVAFVGLEHALHAGLLDQADRGNLFELATALSGLGWIVLISFTKAYQQVHHDIAPAAVSQIYPVTCTETIAHLRAQSPMPGNARTEALLELFAFVSAGFADLILAAAGLDGQDELTRALDFLVLGAASRGAPAFFEKGCEEVQARLTSTWKAKQTDPIFPVAATLGAGVRIQDIPYVGAALADLHFDPGLRVDQQLAIARLVALVQSGLATASNPSQYPVSWRKDYPEVWMVNPFVRPLARNALSAKVVAELDRWADRWARQKLYTLSHFAELPGHRELALAQFAHAAPLFGASIWIAMQRGGHHELVRAVRWTATQGLWPAGVDAGRLLQDLGLEAPVQKSMESDDAGKEGAAWRLYEKATTLQANGSFAAAEKILRSLEKTAHDAQDHSLLGYSLVRLATVLIDSGKFQEADSILSEAGGLVALHGPASLKPAIAYESGSAKQSLGAFDEARAQYQNTIPLSRSLHRDDLECLSYQNLAEMELAFPAAIAPAEGFPPQVARQIQLHANQAEDYVNKAEAAAVRGGFAEAQRPAHLDLRGQIAQYRGQTEDAQRLFAQAAAGFETSGDWRAQRVKDRAAVLRIFHRL